MTILKTVIISRIHIIALQAKSLRMHTNSQNKPLTLLIQKIPKGALKVLLLIPVSPLLLIYTTSITTKVSHLTNTFSATIRSIRKESSRHLVESHLNFPPGNISRWWQESLKHCYRFPWLIHLLHLPVQLITRFRLTDPNAKTSVKHRSPYQMMVLH